VTLNDILTDKYLRSLLCRCTLL